LTQPRPEPATRWIKSAHGQVVLSIKREAKRKAIVRLRRAPDSLSRKVTSEI
jgi:hypothetical protein